MAADLGTGFINILPKSTAFGPALIAKVKPALDALERSTGLAFSSMELAGIAAFVGISAASIKFASDFEKSMSRVQGLVGISATETAKLSDEVLNLATTVPVGPKELADALFFVESAGFRGTEAMNILTLASKASAAGLGETKTVADALTSAMNAYAGTGLTAAHATDVLIAAVREGKLEPATLAANLGQVLPVAAQLGVSFDEVAAGIASATREGLQATRAATGIRFLLAAFTKPSQQAEEALAGVGFSLESLQKSLANRGLLPTLTDLSKRFDLTTSAGKKLFATVVGGVRGLSVASILVGKNAEAVRGIFEDVQNSTNSLNEAFEVSQQNFANQVKQLGATLQVLAIEAGRTLLPVAKDIVTVFKVLLTVIRPLASSFGTLVEVLGGLYILNKIATAMTALSVSAAEAGLAVTAEGDAALVAAAENEALAAAEGEAALAGKALAESQLAAGTATRGGGLAKAASGMTALTTAALALAPAVIIGSHQIDGLFKGADDLANQFGVTEEATTALQEAVGSGPLSGGSGGVLHGFADFFATSGTKAEEATQAYKDVAQAALDAGVSQDVINQAFTAALPALNANRASIADFTNDFRGQIAAYNSIAFVQAKYQTGLDEESAALVVHGKMTKEALGEAEATAGLYDRQLHGIAALTAAEQDHAKSIADTTVKYKDLSGQQQLIVDFGRDIAKGYANIGPLFDLMGTSMAGFQQAADAALTSGKWEEFADSTVKAASEAIQAFHDSAIENLSFLDTTFGELGEKAGIDAIIGSFKEAGDQTGDFGKDLKEIGNIAHGAGSALAQYLVATGDAAHAETIADSSIADQKRAVKAFNTTQGAVEQMANAVTNQLIPTLKDLQDLLGAISGQYNAELNVRDHATTVLNDIRAQLKEIDGHVYSFDVTGHIHTVATGPNVPGGPGSPYDRTAEGGIIHGASGFITKGPTFLVGEGSYGTKMGTGAEAVIPLNDRGIGKLKKAVGRGDGSWDAEGMSAAIAAGLSGMTVQIVDSNLGLVMEGVLDDRGRYDRRMARNHR